MLMPLDTKSGLREGSVTLRRGEITYRGQWAATGNRLIVYLGLDEESALLGMFEKEPETLARILLSDLIKRHRAKPYALR
jgi:hypothetical protein